MMRDYSSVSSCVFDANGNPYPATETAASRRAAESALESSCDGAYYSVQPWMTRRLGLRGAVLAAYALVWSICREDPSGWLYGGHEAVSDACGISKRTSRRAISSLEEMGLVEVGNWIDSRGQLRIAVRPVAGIAALCAGTRCESGGRDQRAEVTPDVSGQNVHTPADKMSALINGRRTRGDMTELQPNARAHARGKQPEVRAESPDCDSSRHRERARVARRRPKPTGRRRGPVPFEVPTVAQVAEYARLRGIAVDARDFVRSGEECGWRDGCDEPIRYWRRWLEGWVAAQPEIEARELARKAAESRTRGATRRKNSRDPQLRGGVSNGQGLATDWIDAFVAERGTNPDGTTRKWFL